MKKEKESRKNIIQIFLIFADFIDFNYLFYIQRDSLIIIVITISSYKSL
jgi:hypothetical protein